VAHGRYPVGNVVRLQGVFTDFAGDVVDPDNVYVQVKTPGGVVTQYTLPNVVRSAAGTYYYDLSVDVEGTWEYRWYSTGNGEAAEEDAFTAEHSEFE